MTGINLMYRIALRASELADMKIDLLRQMVSSDEYGSLHAAKQECLGMSRGKLIEVILTDEFEREAERVSNE